MGIKVALEHRTSYTFDRLVEVFPHVVRLRPAPHSRTPIEAYSLQVEPADHFVNWQQDAFGNFLARLVFPTRARSLTITVGLIADMKVINPFDFFIEEYAETFPFEYTKDLLEDLKPYLRPVDEDDVDSGPGELAQAWVKNFVINPGMRTIDFLVAVNRGINADVGYSVRMEPGVQTPDFTLRTGIGSCRDSAWLLVSVLRQMGLAARFVSGYLVQLTSGRRGARRSVGAGGRLHRPARMGRGVHPRRGLDRARRHVGAVRRARGTSRSRRRRTRRRRRRSPARRNSCETTLDFSNVVTRVHEDPRVTLPYTDSAWDAILRAGRPRRRPAGRGRRPAHGGWRADVRLDRQPGRPGVDHRRRRARTSGERASALAALVKEKWAPQGLVQRSQGKWYPGEPLPRWQIGLLWRADGQPAVDRRRAPGRPWSRRARAQCRARCRPAGARRHRGGPEPARLTGAARLRGRVESPGKRGAPARR